MTAIYYDTEFIEDGHTIDLISIGMIREDGAELYLVNGDPRVISRAWEHLWLRENVIPSLPLRPSGIGAFWDWDRNHPDFLAINRRDAIAVSVREFIQATPDPQLWAWYGAYDHVVMCQLWGRMIDRPDGVPMWTNDLKQECVRLGDPQVPQQGAGEHNALADARHNKVIAEFLRTLRGGAS